MTFALLIIIIIIGIFQDKLFVYLDKKFFPYKHQILNKYGPVKTKSIFDVVFAFAGNIFGVLLAVIFIFFTINQFTHWFVFDDLPILSYYFGDTVWTFYFLALCALAYFVYNKFVK